MATPICSPRLDQLLLLGSAARRRSARSLSSAGDAGQLVQDVAPRRLVTAIVGPDGPAALADHASRHRRDPPSSDADRAAVDDLAVDEQPRRSRARRPGRQAADERQPGQRLVGPLDERVDREAIRVGQQHADHVVVAPLRHADHGQAGRSARTQRLQAERLERARRAARAAQTLTALASSTPWPPPITPEALQPTVVRAPAARRRASSAASTASGSSPVTKTQTRSGAARAARAACSTADSAASTGRVRAPGRPRSAPSGASPTVRPLGEAAPFAPPVSQRWHATCTPDIARRRCAVRRTTSRVTTRPRAGVRSRAARRSVDPVRASLTAEAPRPTDHAGRAARQPATSHRTVKAEIRDNLLARLRVRRDRASPASSASTTPCCPSSSAPCSPGTTSCCSASAARARPG